MKTFIIAAVSADGFIGRDSRHTADWTGKEDKKIFVQLTRDAGVVIMGSNTFRTIGRALPGRRTIVLTHDPKSLAIPGIESTSETPADLLARLKKENCHAVAICGGASVYNAFMQAGLVDELYLTVVPRLFGNGQPLFGGSLDIPLQLLESTSLPDGAVLLHYAAA